MFVDLEAAFPPFSAAGRRHRSESTHPETEQRHIYRHCCRNRDSKNQRTATPAVASGPAQLKEWAVGEAAMSGQPASTRARSGSPGNSPSRIAGLPPASPQSSFGQPSQGPTFSVNSLCGRLLHLATEKLLAIVQKLWTMELPCGSLRKTKNKFILTCKAHLDSIT